MENNNENNNLTSEHSANGSVENKSIEVEVSAEPVINTEKEVEQETPQEPIAKTEKSGPVTYTAQGLLDMTNDELIEIGNAITIPNCGVMKKEDLCSAILRAQRKLNIIKN